MHIDAQYAVQNCGSARFLGVAWYSKNGEKGMRSSADRIPYLTAVEHGAQSHSLNAYALFLTRTMSQHRHLLPDVLDPRTAQSITNTTPSRYGLLIIQTTS